MNKITLMGRLVYDCEVVVSGKCPIMKNTIAVDRAYKDEDGEKITDFFNIIAFMGKAETMAKYCKKGDRILISGELQNNKYEDKDGNVRDWYQVVINDLDFIESKPKEDEASKIDDSKKPAKKYTRR